MIDQSKIHLLTFKDGCKRQIRFLSNGTTKGYGSSWKLINNTVYVFDSQRVVIGEFTQKEINPDSIDEQVKPYISHIIDSHPIIRAKWGVNGNYIDVTEKARQLFDKDGKIDATVGNFGDHVKGKRKHLMINQNIKVNEHESLDSNFNISKINYKTIKTATIKPFDENEYKSLKKLVWYIAFGKDKHFNNVKFSIDMLLKNGKYDGDIIVLSDKNSYNGISDKVKIINIYNDYKMKCKTDKLSIRNIWCAKAEIVNYVDIKHYDICCYIDGDIAIQGDISSILYSVYLDKCIYVQNNGGISVVTQDPSTGSEVLDKSYLSEYSQIQLCAGLFMFYGKNFGYTFIKSFEQMQSKYNYKYFDQGILYKIIIDNYFECNLVYHVPFAGFVGKTYNNNYIFAHGCWGAFEHYIKTLNKEPEKQFKDYEKFIMSHSSIGDIVCSLNALENLGKTENKIMNLYVNNYNNYNKVKTISDFFDLKNVLIQNVNLSEDKPDSSFRSFSVFGMECSWVYDWPKKWESKYYGQEHMIKAKSYATPIKDIIGISFTVNFKPEKNISEHSIKKLIDRLLKDNKKIIYFGARNTDTFLNEYKDMVKIMTDKDDLKDIMTNIQSCEHFYGADSGMAWLSVFSKIPTTIIVGTSFGKNLPKTFSKIDYCNIIGE